MNIAYLTTVARRLAIELGRYLAGSPHSRLRQLETLRGLDHRQFADVGLRPEDIRTIGSGLFDAPAGARHDFERAPDYARF